ncbi:hypothetical protein P7C70_g6930, partial [Phenoliferia sp. Uapishka_3]
MPPSAPAPPRSSVIAEPGSSSDDEFTVVVRPRKKLSLISPKQPVLQKSSQPRQTAPSYPGGTSKFKEAHEKTVNKSDEVAKLLLPPPITQVGPIAHNTSATAAVSGPKTKGPHVEIDTLILKRSDEEDSASPELVLRSPHRGRAVVRSCDGEPVLSTDEEISERPTVNPKLRKSSDQKRTAVQSDVQAVLSSEDEGPQRTILKKGRSTKSSGKKFDAVNEPKKIPFVIEISEKAKGKKRAVDSDVEMADVEPPYKKNPQGILTPTSNESPSPLEDYPEFIIVHSTDSESDGVENVPRSPRLRQKVSGTSRSKRKANETILVRLSDDEEELDEALYEDGFSATSSGAGALTPSFNPSKKVKHEPIFVSKAVFQYASRHYPNGALRGPAGSEAESLEAIRKEDKIRQSLIESMAKARLDHELDLDPICELVEDENTKRKRESENGPPPTVFYRAKVGEKTYCALDCVAMKPDPDHETAKLVAPWFARILYFTEIDGVASAHIQWFEHHSAVKFDGKHLYGESADFRQLFLTDHWSATVPSLQPQLFAEPTLLSVTTLQSRHSLQTTHFLVALVIVNWQRPNQPVPDHELVPDHVYVYCYSWDENERRMDDPAKLARNSTPLCEKAGKPSCPSCERREEEKVYQVPKWVSQKNEVDLSFDYQDDVLIFFNDNKVFEVGKITDVSGVNCEGKGRPTLHEKSKVTVQYYRRKSDLLRDPNQSDRDLILTTSTQTFSISSLKGHAVVRHRSEFEAEYDESIELSTEAEVEAAELDRERKSALARLQFLKTPGTFFIAGQVATEDPTRDALKIFANSSDVEHFSREKHINNSCLTLSPTPKSCRQEFEDLAEYEKSTPPLKAIDLFAGGGGAAEGSHQAGINTVIAVELNNDAVRVYRENHPKVIVCQEDVCEFAEELERNGPSEVVDVVWASPPCQPHSTANINAKSDDPRILLALTAVSVAESYKAKYIVFENVPQMMSASLPVDGKVVKGACWALIVSTLLDAGLGVPTVPIPAEGTLPRSWRKADCDHQGASAPHAGPVVADMTSDLPAFEYAPLSEDELEAPPPTWLRPDFPQYSYKTIHNIELPQYHLPPQTLYQESLRLDQRADLRYIGAPLSSHQIARVHQKLGVERLSHIPIGGNHKDLPLELKLPPLPTKGRERSNTREFADGLSPRRRRAPCSCDHPLGHDKAQDLIDQITKMYESGGPPPGRPFPNAPTGMGGPMGGMGGPMGPPMRFGPPMGMGGPPMGGPPPFQQGSPFTPGAPIHFGQGPPPQFQQPPPQFFGGGAPPPMGMAPPPGFRPPPGMAPPPGFFGGASSISSGPNLQPQQQQQQQQQPPMAQPGGAPPAKLVNGMSEDRARMLGLI